MDIEEISLPVTSPEMGKFCYATLTRHPYNPLKMLGQLTNEEVDGWMRSKEEVVWASDSIPMLISYNAEFARSAFHILLANVRDVAKEYQYAYIPSQTYSLKSIAEVPHYEILAQLIYEENTQGSPITNVVLNSSVKKGHILLYAGNSEGEIRAF